MNLRNWQARVTMLFKRDEIALGLPLHLAIICSIILAEPSLRSIILGSVITVIGLAVAILGLGYENREIVDPRGLKLVVRYPLVLSLFLLLAGACVAARTVGPLMIAMASGAIILKLIFNRYDRDVLDTHTLRYKRYQRYISAIVPTLLPFPHDYAGFVGFSFRRVLKAQNRLVPKVVLLSILVIGFLVTLVYVDENIFMNIGVAVIYSTLALSSAFAEIKKLLRTFSPF
jgi:hypothetical protein